MFNSKKRTQRLMETIGMIKPTSKAALKQQCLFLANLDVDKAEKMYDFLVKDMQEIPAVEPVPVSFVENFGKQANGVLGWFRENQDVLSEGFKFIRGIVSRKGAAPSSPLPPING